MRVVFLIATFIILESADGSQPDFNHSPTSNTPSIITVEYDAYSKSTVSSSESSNCHAPRSDYNNTINSGNNATMKKEVDETKLWQYQLGLAIYKYGLPVVVVLATVGNTVSIITLQHPTFHKSSTSFILSALALVDLVYADFAAMYQWFTLFGNDYDITLKSSFSCKFTIFMYFFPRMVTHSLNIFTRRNFKRPRQRQHFLGPFVIRCMRWDI